MQNKQSKLLRILANPKIEDILRVLLRIEHDELNATEIAAECKIFTSYFTKLTAKLVEVDLVTRLYMNQNVYLVLNRNKASMAMMILHKAKMFEDV